MIFIVLKSAMLNWDYSFAIGLLTIVMMKGVGGCSVDWIDKAAVVGDDISVTCSAGGTLKVSEWRFDGEIAFQIFRTKYYDYSTQSYVNAYLKDGYFINNISNPVLKESTLTIKKVNHSNAGVYSCQCADENAITPLASATSNIVTVSTPKFSTTTDLRDGEPISFICNISYSGIADSSIAIEDFVGNDFTTGNYTANLKGLHSFALNYDVTANSTTDQRYWCNVTLTNDSPNAQLYSTKLQASVQWTPVQNVKINANEKCINGSQCAINEVLLCSADGNPKPGGFNWTRSINGSEPTKIVGDRLALTVTGQHTIQCTAFNFIRNVRYQSISGTFTTQVTADGPKIESSQDSSGQSYTLIVGLVVGLGGSIIAVTIVALGVMFCIRKKRQENKAEVYTSVILGKSQQDIYTELQTSPVDHELQNDHHKLSLRKIMKL